MSFYPCRYTISLPIGTTRSGPLIDAREGGIGPVVDCGLTIEELTSLYRTLLFDGFNAHIHGSKEDGSVVVIIKDGVEELTKSAIMPDRLLREMDSLFTVFSPPTQSKDDRKKGIVVTIGADDIPPPLTTTLQTIYSKLKLCITHAMHASSFAEDTKVQVQCHTGQCAILVQRNGREYGLDNGDFYLASGSSLPSVMQSCDTP